MTVEQDGPSEGRKGVLLPACSVGKSRPSSGLHILKAFQPTKMLAAASGLSFEGQSSIRC